MAREDYSIVQVCINRLLQMATKSNDLRFAIVTQIEMLDTTRKLSQQKLAGLVKNGHRYILNSSFYSALKLQDMQPSDMLYIIAYLTCCCIPYNLAEQWTMHANRLQRYPLLGT